MALTPLRRRPTLAPPHAASTVSIAEPTLIAAPPDDDSPNSPLVWPATLTWIFAFLIAGSMAAFRMLDTMPAGNGLTRDRTLFTILNAATLTGFRQDISPESYRPAGQIILFILTLGGTMWSLATGGMLVSRILRLPYGDKQIAVATAVVVVLAVCCGSTILISPTSGLLASLQLAASAIGNSGVVFAPVPAADNLKTQLLLLPLAVVGSLGVVVVMDFLAAVIGRRKLSRHSRTAIGLSAGVYVAAVVLIGLLELVARSAEMHAEKHALVARDVTTAIIDASTVAIDSRTAGLPTISLANFARPSQWIVLILMALGGVSGSAAGGIKVNTIGVIAGETANAYRRRPVSRALAVAVASLTAYGFVVVLTTVSLSQTAASLDSTKALFLAVSAVSNVGLSHDAVSLTGGSLVVLSAAMLAGRALPIVMLWWVWTLRDDDASPVG